MQSIQGNLIIRSHYIRPINIHRPKRGEFYTLLQEIRDMDEDMHLNVEKYWRMLEYPDEKYLICLQSNVAVKHNAHLGQLRLVRARWIKLRAVQAHPLILSLTFR